MLIPPILEVYVLWHPDDTDGETIANSLLDHFHGTTFSGLIGGAVEVYVRSAGWTHSGGPPRPMPFMDPLPNGLPAPAVTAVVPVLGTRLARAVENDPDWSSYLDRMVEAAGSSDRVGLFPLRLDPAATAGTALAAAVSEPQFLDPRSASDAAVLARDLAQSIAQLIGDPAIGERLQVFISHTKRHSPDEEPDEVDELVAHIRSVIGSTHLRAFFDAADIQPGTDWFQQLVDEASRSGLLMVRTDLYAGREWCQREVLLAKRAGMPLVTLYAVSGNEERGSFILDHAPTVPFRREDDDAKATSIEQALNLLVDEALKRALWNEQKTHLSGLGFDWLPVHAPEPITILPWLLARRAQGVADDHTYVLHPDPPLGPDESKVIGELFALSGLADLVDVMTPRTFASRGGRVSP